MLAQLEALSMSMQMTITICSTGTFGFWEERKLAAPVIDTLACTDQAMLG